MPYKFKNYYVLSKIFIVYLFGFCPSVLYFLSELYIYKNVFELSVT